MTQQGHTAIERTKTKPGLLKAKQGNFYNSMQNVMQYGDFI